MTTADLGHYGEHYYLRSTLGPDQIRGRGVTHLGLNAYQPQSGPVTHKYRVTCAAFDRLAKQIEIVCPERD